MYFNGLLNTADAGKVNDDHLPSQGWSTKILDYAKARMKKNGALGPNGMPPRGLGYDGWDDQIGQQNFITRKMHSE